MSSSSTDSSDVLPGAAGAAGAAAGAGSEAGLAPEAWRSYSRIVLWSVAALLFATEIALREVAPLIEAWPRRVDLVYRAKTPDAVLGDSHIVRGFNTQDAFANLGGGGSTVPAMEIVAREYYRHRDPGRVIVAASPQLFARSRDAEGTQQHDEYFTENWGLPFQLYIFEPGIARAVSFLLDPFALAKRIRDDQERKIPDNPTEAFLQREVVEGTPEEKRKYTQLFVRRNRPLEDFRSSESFASYQRLLDFLIARGASVCLLRTPVTQTFEEMTTDDPAYVALHAALRELARERNIPYVDYRQLGVRFRDELFVDPHHLTARGATFFAGRAIAACFGHSPARRDPRDVRDARDARAGRDQFGQ